MPTSSEDNVGILEQVAPLRSAISKGSPMMITGSHLSRQASLIRSLDDPTPQLTCPHCGGDLPREDRPSAPLSDALIHALLDRFLAIEAELQQIRRILVEEVLP
jgi:hypothetical protein